MLGRQTTFFKGTFNYVKNLIRKNRVIAEIAESVRNTICIAPLSRDINWTWTTLVEHLLLNGVIVRNKFSTTQLDELFK